MYRVITLMCFGECAVKIHKMAQPGTVLACMAPKFMAHKPGTETGSQQ